MENPTCASIEGSSTNHFPPKDLEKNNSHLGRHKGPVGLAWMQSFSISGHSSGDPQSHPKGLNSYKPNSRLWANSICNPGPPNCHKQRTSGARSTCLFSKNDLHKRGVELHELRFYVCIQIKNSYFLFNTVKKKYNSPMNKRHSLNSYACLYANYFQPVLWNINFGGGRE